MPRPRRGDPHRSPLQRRTLIRFAPTLALGFLLGALTTAGAVAVSTTVADEETRQAITAVKAAIVRGHMQRDAAALSRLYADDYTATDAKGAVRTKQQLLAGLPTDEEIVDGRYDIIAVRRWGALAVATGRGHLVRKSGTSDYYSFNVFEQRDGRWLYVAAFLP